MIPFDSDVIVRLARKQKISLGNAEKDYVLSVALHELSLLGLDVVFKGGTCLKKAYFPSFRFSSDLDFTFKGDVKRAKAAITAAFENKVVQGISFKKAKSLETVKQANLILGLQYVSEISQSGCVDSVRIELSSESKVVQKPENRKMLEPTEYSLPETNLLCLTLQEVLAEKVHAIYHRRKPRDLFDLAYLLEQGVKPDFSLVAEKLKPLNLALSKQTFLERSNNLEPSWNQDMRGLVEEVPDFSKTQSMAVNALFGY